MATKKVIKNEVRLNFNNVIDIMEKRGVKKTIPIISAENDFTSEGLHKLQKKASKGVKFLYHFLKDNMLEIDDLVEEIKP